MQNQKWIEESLTIIVVVIIVYFLKVLKAMFIPLIFALFLTFLFAPLNRILNRRNAPLPLVMTILVILIFVSFGILGISVYAGVSSFLEGYPKYEKQMFVYITSFLHSFDSQTSSLAIYIKNNLTSEDLIGKISFSKIIAGTMGTFMDFLLNLSLTLIFMLFIVAGKSRFINKLAEAFATDTTPEHTTHILIKIETGMKKYIVYKTIISLLTAIVAMIFMAIFGVDFIIIGGLLIFMLNFIPNIGSVIASAFPVLVCFMEFGLGWRVFAVTGSMFITQFTFGNILEPKIMGNELNLSPIIILISLIFWSWVWGSVGMVLAVPITSSINIILKEFKSMDRITSLMSDY